METFIAIIIIFFYAYYIHLIVLYHINHFNQIELCRATDIKKHDLIAKCHPISVGVVYVCVCVRVYVTRLEYRCHLTFNVSAFFTWMFKIHFPNAFPSVRTCPAIRKYT